MPDLRAWRSNHEVVDRLFCERAYNAANARELRRPEMEIIDHDNEYAARCCCRLSICRDRLRANRRVGVRTKLYGSEGLNGLRPAFLGEHEVFPLEVGNGLAGTVRNVNVDADQSCASTKNRRPLLAVRMKHCNQNRGRQPCVWRSSQDC